jgi:hypothetical protein
MINIMAEAGLAGGLVGDSETELFHSKNKSFWKPQVGQFR